MRKYLLLLAMTLAMLSFGSTVRSNVGGRACIYNQEEVGDYTAADYVQDGLIAMWDGIENSGYGVHEDNITLWKDLTGSGADWQIGKAFKVLDNGIEILAGISWNGQGHLTQTTWSNTDNLFAEFVIDLSEVDLTALTRDNGYDVLTLRVGSGGSGPNDTKCPALTVSKNGMYLVQGYNTYPTINLPLRPCSISWQAGYSRTRLNEAFVGSPRKGPGSNYIYFAPSISSYSSFPCLHAKILAIRLYTRTLSDAETLHNYRIDRVRFRLP